MEDNITSKTLRYPLIDYIRGFAVLLMIIFHFFYDLNLYQFVKIDFYKDPFWFYLPRLIVTLFLSTVGISLCLANIPIIKWRKTLYRVGKLLIFAAMISTTTYFLYRNSWVYFGTLHCIALCSIAAIPFLKLPKTSLLISLGILIPHIFFDLKLPWILLKHRSMDYIPFFPWIAVTLLGIWLYHIKFHQLLRREIPALSILKFLGRHAFIIYILHQPILVGLVWTASKLKP